MVRVRMQVGHGWVRGELHPNEDLRGLAEILDAPLARLRDDPGALCVHADLRAHLSTARRDVDRAHKLERITRGVAKRYVLRADTSAGPRIIKIAQPTSVSGHLQGLVGSLGEREHRAHSRGEAMDIAAARTLGYLVLRRGPLLVRTAQLQEPMSALPSLEDALGPDPSEKNLARLGEALAATHRLGFFHADLKGFHTFVETREENWWLRFIDFGRVSFSLTQRRRVINLYQALRFLVPRDAAAQECFLAAYCRAAPWLAEDVDGAARIVRAFLAHKVRTHPVVESEHA